MLMERLPHIQCSAMMGGSVIGLLGPDFRDIHIDLHIILEVHLSQPFHWTSKDFDKLS